MKKLILIFLLSFLLLPIYAQNTLIAYYKLDGDAKDYSNNNNHGNLIGNVQVTEDRLGNQCGAVSFDGRNSFIEIPSSSSLNFSGNEVTITAWVKLNENADNWWLTVCSKGDQSTENNTSPHYRMQFTKVTASLNTQCVESWDVDYERGEWMFFAMTYDGNYLNIYRNGVNIYSEQKSFSLSSNNQALNIGRDIPGNAEYFHGSIDDLRIYSDCLSQTEIQNIYHDTPVVNCDNNSSGGTGCSFPDNVGQTQIIYEYEELTIQDDRIMIFGYDNMHINDVIKIHVNGVWLNDEIQLTSNRVCIEELLLNKKCNYILFKSMNNLAVFSIEINGIRYNNIECDEDDLFAGIKIYKN